MSKNVDADLDRFSEDYDKLYHSFSIRKLWRAAATNIYQVWDINKDEEGNFSVDVIVSNDGGSTIPGIYRWRDITGITNDHDVNEGDKIYLYSGKAGKGSAVGNRNTSHRKSIVDTSSNEATGKQVREYMKKKKLSTLRICVQYIDMSKQTNVIDMLEEMTIETFETPFNKENRSK